MVKSHYVPQLILRNFCKDNKIQYFDLNTKKTESRSTKSVFMEKGYYPRELEQALCHKIEAQFANLLNNKILNERYRICLNAHDMLILKKYLIITMLRVRDDELEQNIWYRELKRSGFIAEYDSYQAFFSGDFYSNINRVLECKSRDSILALAEKGENLNLFTFIKDVIYSYNVFVKSNNSKEDFVISDRGWAGYRGPLGVKKLNAMMNMLEIKYDPFIEMLIHMSSPQDYAVYPLSKTMALVTISPAYKVLLPGAPYNIIYPEEAPTLSACLGFGDSKTIEPPENRMRKDGQKEYLYTIKQLPRHDVIFINGLMIKNADNYIGYADANLVKNSFAESGLTL